MTRFRVYNLLPKGEMTMRQTVFGLAVSILTGATLLAQAPAHKPMAKAGASAGEQTKIK